MAAESRHVFIDTEVFDHHQLDFSSPRLRRLVRLADAGELKLILTDVTLGEIESHLDDTAAASAKQISNFRKINRVVRDVIGPEKLAEMAALTKDELVRRLRKELRQFLREAKADVVTVDGTRPSEVFKRYFRCQAPFNKGKKKSEFPDAFAGAALQAWCNGPPTRKLYILSGDEDWKRLCDETEEFIYLGRLDELLEKFADSEAVTYLRETINSENEELIALLKKEIEGGNVYIHVDDSVMDGEVNEVEDLEIEVDDANVIEAKDGKAIVGLFCRVHMTLNVSGMDPDSMWRDPDDGSFHSVWTASGSVEREIDMEATVEVLYDVRAPQKISIKSVSFQQTDIGISVGEGELTPNYDGNDDFDDYDPQWEPEEPVDGEDGGAVEF